MWSRRQRRQPLRQPCRLCRWRRLQRRRRRSGSRPLTRRRRRTWRPSSARTWTTTPADAFNRSAARILASSATRRTRAGRSAWRAARRAPTSWTRARTRLGPARPWAIGRPERSKSARMTGEIAPAPSAVQVWACSAMRRTTPMLGASLRAHWASTWVMRTPGLGPASPTVPAHPHPRLGSRRSVLRASMIARKQSAARRRACSASCRTPSTASASLRAQPRSGICARRRAL
mmetsp:Transcript_99986/g.261242  ORF Transcript_99986/g.261242 Transcript_99986/m.261242 type:complete len:232 (-) Transcript_99986:1037-1732(-)